MEEHATVPALTVYYDGACPICRRSALWFRRRATAGDVGFVDYHEALEQQREPLPSEETLAHALCAVTADRIQLSGVDALLAILRACGYRRTARLLSLPGLRTLARLVYRFVAAHRSSISRILFGGCDREGACRL